MTCFSYESIIKIIHIFKSGELIINKVQTAAYELLQSDARFFYTLIQIDKISRNIDSNYIMMSQPYIAMFADGAEQWCTKMKLDAPKFSKVEKIYYSKVRQSNKLFELHYSEYLDLLLTTLHICDNFFYRIRSELEKQIGYYNVGTDLFCGEYCGNTILGAMYMPFDILNHKESGIWLRNLSVIAGRLAGYFRCTDFPSYKFDNVLRASYKDYHFFMNSPLKINNELGFVLFSVLCSINYVIVFLEKYITEEIPQKFKFAYIQYYYLCSFIKELNQENNLNFTLDNSLYNRNVRNCFSHYGLGVFLKESDVVRSDLLKGITQKAFGEDYYTSKRILYSALNDLSMQIKEYIF